MNKVLKVILITLLPIILQANSCWTRVELANFAEDEFSGKARFSIKDAITCEPIAHAKFFLGSIKFTSDDNGTVTLPLPPENMDRDLPITIKKDGYIIAKEHVAVIFGSYRNNLFLMSKSMPIHSARFVLSWGNEPSDLDIHLKTNNYHISYRNTKNITNSVKLDRDAMHGYGPETITVNTLDKDDTYRLIVHSYSGEKLNNKVKFRIYLNNKLNKIVKLKNTQAKCVQVATIVNNKITYNQKDLKISECR